MQSILQDFQTILQLPCPEEIVHNLEQTVTSESFFLQQAQSLPVLPLDTATGDILYETIPKENIQYFASGTYGKIYRSNNPTYAYKEIPMDEPDPKQRENNLREVFLEIFVATILSKDERYKPHICQPFALYTMENSVFLKMKYYPTTFEEHVQTSDWTRILHQLCPLLTNLQRDYRFHHRDLHTKNVMFDEERIVLIDLGFSTIHWEGKTYSEHGTHSKPYDILIFLSSFLEGYSEHIGYIDKQRLISLFETRNGKNLYVYWDKHTTKPTTHMFYDWIMVDKYPLDIFYEILATDFSPVTVQAKIEDMYNL